MGHLVVDATKSWVKELQAGDAQKSAAYCSRRRSTGAGMLRLAIYKLAEEAMEVNELETVIKVLKVTVIACTWVTRLMETERF
jgi:hypothetical protein